MYPFRSLDIAVGFEDRVYTLGEEIDLSITLAAKRGANIRGLVAELVCEERWSRLAFVNERPASERSTTSSEFIGYMVDRVTDVKPLFGDGKDSRPEHGRWAEVDHDDDRQQRYVLGTTHLAQGLAVAAGTTTLSHKIKLPTGPPPHAEKARVEWTLRVRADVAWGPDAKAELIVRVIY